MMHKQRVRLFSIIISALVWLNVNCIAVTKDNSWQDSVVSSVISDDTTGLILFAPDTFRKKYSASLTSEAWESGAFTSDEIAIVKKASVISVTVCDNPCASKDIFEGFIPQVDYVGHIMAECDSLFRVRTVYVVAGRLLYERYVDNSSLDTNDILLGKAADGVHLLVSPKPYYLGKSVAREYYKKKYSKEKMLIELE